MEKIRIQNAESAKRYRLGQRNKRIDRQMTRQMTLPDASCSDSLTVTRQSKKEKKNRELPPTVPQGGTDADLIANDSEAKESLNQLFGRKRAWSDEEDAL